MAEAEGSVQNPFRENPPTRLTEVHWTSGLAVKWRADQYVHAGGLTAAPNSPTGTLAFWVKFNLDLSSYREITAISGNELAYQLRLAPGDMTGHGSGDMAVDFAPGDPLDIRPVSLRFDLAIVDRPGYYSVDGVVHDEFAFEGSMVSDGIVFGGDSGGLNRWFHVYCEWNTQAGEFLLRINGATAASAALPGTTVGTESDGIFGFDVPWHQQPPMFRSPALNQNTVFFWWDQAPDLTYPTPPYSLAEFWLAPNRTGVGADRFVDVATGRPKSLGANGELPLVGLPGVPPGEKPAFYFHRSGEPKTFLTNRGYAGEFTLAKTVEDFPEIVRAPIDDVDRNGPQDEPDNPHFTPAG